MYSAVRPAILAIAQVGNDGAPILS